MTCKRCTPVKQKQRSIDKASSIHVHKWNRAEICAVTSHSVLVPSWRASSGDCVTDGEDRVCEERLGAGVLNEEIAAEEADVPAPGLVNWMLWLTACMGCAESMPPENSRKQEYFVCICTDNYRMREITFDFTRTTKTVEHFKERHLQTGIYGKSCLDF